MVVVVVYVIMQVQMLVVELAAMAVAVAGLMVQQVSLVRQTLAAVVVLDLLQGLAAVVL